MRRSVLYPLVAIGFAVCLYLFGCSKPVTDGTPMLSAVKWDEPTQTVIEPVVPTADTPIATVPDVDQRQAELDRIFAIVEARINKRIDEFGTQLKSELNADAVAKADASEGLSGRPGGDEESTQTYQEAIARVKATGQPVEIYFYDSSNAEPIPTDGYVCDLAGIRSTSFARYWLGDDATPVSKTAKLLTGTNTVVVDQGIAISTPTLIVQRQPGPTWTWPGNLRTHLISHGYSSDEIADLSQDALRILHDNEHNGYGRMTNTVQQSVRSSGFSSSCPSGNCGGGSMRRGWFGR